MNELDCDTETGLVCPHLLAFLGHGSQSAHHFLGFTGINNAATERRHYGTRHRVCQNLRAYLSRKKERKKKKIYLNTDINSCSRLFSVRVVNKTSCCIRPMFPASCKVWRSLSRHKDTRVRCSTSLQLERELSSSPTPRTQPELKKRNREREGEREEEGEAKILKKYQKPFCIGVPLSSLSFALELQD